MVYSFPSHIKPSVPFRRNDVRDGSHDETWEDYMRPSVVVPRCEHCNEPSASGELCISCLQELVRQNENSNGL